MEAADQLGKRLRLVWPLKEEQRAEVSPRGGLSPASGEVHPAVLPFSSRQDAASSLDAPLQQSRPVTKEEVGRSTWVFLHSVAAQYPAEPTRQQKKDAKMLVDCLTRLYPCAECAQHFQDIVRDNPPEVDSGVEFQQWMCRVHNTVNRSIGKPTFNCDLVQSRWQGLDCGEDSPCDMTVGVRKGRR